MPHRIIKYWGKVQVSWRVTLNVTERTIDTVSHEAPVVLEQVLRPSTVTVSELVMFKREEVNRIYFELCKFDIFMEIFYLINTWKMEIKFIKDL